MIFLEILGFITGIIGIWFTIRQNIWCFPVGLVNVSISMVLFYQTKLYSDALQQCVYIILLSYGWFNWSANKNKSGLEVSYLNFIERLWSLIAVTLTALLLGTFFSTYSDADVPYWDATATALSFLAQYLIAKKKIENWKIWILVNIMYIGIYLYKDLYLYALLFAVYLALAVYGYLDWKKSISSPPVLNE